MTAKMGSRNPAPRAMRDYSWCKLLTVGKDKRFVEAPLFCQVRLRSRRISDNRPFSEPPSANIFHTASVMI